MASDDSSDSNPKYNMQWSNLLLMISGKFLIILVIIMVFSIDTKPLMMSLPLLK